MNTSYDIQTQEVGDGRSEEVGNIGMDEGL